jgi:hypothetical protein
MIALALSDPFKEGRDCRPIRRALPDVMQRHHPHWIHENVATQLVDIAGGASWPMASADQLDVCPPGRGPPDGPPPATPHPIGAIESTLPVNQQGPPQTRLAHGRFSTLPSLERDDQDPKVQPFDLVLVPSQLRQMLAAGQSQEVPVEDDQQPVAPVLLETMNGTGGVLQRKRDGGRPDLALHLTLSWSESAAQGTARKPWALPSRSV